MAKTRPALPAPAPGWDPANPFIVQSDRSVLVEVDNPKYAEARDALAPFAELEKSPEHIHSYRITPLSLWNAAAAGMTADEIVATLAAYGKWELPSNVRTDILEYIARYGRLKLVREAGELRLTSADRPLIAEIWHNLRIRPHLV